MQGGTSKGLCCAGVSALRLRHGLLCDQPVTDDEGAYDFIARTLLEGRIVNPLPQGDPAYFANQFIVIGESGWFGKYALGHRALLAPFALVGRLDLAGPVFAVATPARAWQLWRSRFAERRAFFYAPLPGGRFVLTEWNSTSPPADGR